MKKNLVSIYFNKAEDKTVKDATEYVVSGETSMIRILLHEELEKTKKSKTITFTYDLTIPYDRETFRTKLFSVSNDDFERIQKICDCIQITPSTLIKYLIMPKLNKIIKDKKMEGKV